MLTYVYVDALELLEREENYFEGLCEGAEDVGVLEEGRQGFLAEKLLCGCLTEPYRQSLIIRH